MNVVQDIFYIGWYHDMLKAGKTHELNERWGGSQYNTGGTKMLPSYAYFAVPSVNTSIDKLETLYGMDFFRFLKSSPKNFKKKLEFIDPRHTHITAETIKEKMEHRMRKHNIKVMRLKQEFICLIPYNPNFSREVREDYLHFCEPVR
jgi:hypothetical protein